jgi:UDP-N-acetyl-D-galactosamine dehydrogenase
MLNERSIVAVVGLGYVGLPLAIEFGKKFRTIGFDLSNKKITAYREHIDPTMELSADHFRDATKLEFTADPNLLSEADFIIIAVPTPIDKLNRPDFNPLEGACKIIGKQMKVGSTVIIESTVYPGATEEICIPILESQSGLKWMEDFHVGYSPERVNPGDKERTITKIVKIVSGDDESTLKLVSNLYESIITAGVYRTSSIKVAEAAKVIENTQRDLNIGLMNELSIIFKLLDIETKEVLNAAGTKWNFIPFYPGLVGGHCIGVDPYYLTHKSEMLGYSPQIILAGRRINNSMAKFVAQECIKKIANKKIYSKDARVIVLGLTFKENCADIRNSKVMDLVREFLDFGCDVQIHDPVAEASEVKNEYDIDLMPWDKLFLADAIIIAVPHKQFFDISIDDLLKKLKPGGLFVDLRSNYSKKVIKEKGFHVWAL